MTRPSLQPSASVPMPEKSSLAQERAGRRRAAHQRNRTRSRLYNWLRRMVFGPGIWG